MLPEEGHSRQGDRQEGHGRLTVPVQARTGPGGAEVGDGVSVPGQRLLLAGSQ